MIYTGYKYIFEPKELDDIKHMLANPKYSKKDICYKYNISLDVIDSIIKKNGFQVIRKEKEYLSIELSDVQKEVLIGCLLGDGCLYLGPNSKNAIFSYTSKHKEMVELVYSYLSPLLNKIEYYEYRDKRTNKTYTRYIVRSISHPIFTSIYHMWYVDGKKCIPKDILYRPLTCLFWYLGDGGIVHHKSTDELYLSTHCFSKSELEIVVKNSELQKFDPHLLFAGTSAMGEEQYKIRISHKFIKEFLSYIGNCPVDCYRYKWEYTEYKNKMPTSHKDKEQLFIKMYKDGMSCYKIAKHFGIETNAVKFYIKKHGLYKPLK